VALFPVLVIIVIMVLVVVYFARHPDSASGARFLKRAGFGLMAFVTAVFALFVVGETVDDPGGWAAAGLIAPWLAPAGLAALYWYRPSLAGRVLIGLTMMLVAVTVWATADSDSWRAFEDHHGPVRTIAVFVLTAAVALLGVKRTRVAGILLLVLGVVPLAVSSLGHLRLGSLAVATTPALITGMLYLISAAFDQGRTPDAPPPKHRHSVG
jgi:hypothetical protein